MFNEKQKKQSSAGHDLAYRLWSTKGSRFRAAERCESVAKISTFAVAFLSVEVIALNLASLAGLLKDIDPVYIPTLTLILSISILVFGIFENAKDYRVRGLKYHSCGLEINKLYNELKRHLSANNQADFNDQTIISDINERFENVLSRHENHQNHDFHAFLLDRHKDFKLNWLKRWEKRAINYYSSKLLYHGLILLGPVLICIYYSLA